MLNPNLICQKIMTLSLSILLCHLSGHTFAVTAQELSAKAMELKALELEVAIANKRKELFTARNPQKTETVMNSSLRPVEQSMNNTPPISNQVNHSSATTKSSVLNTQNDNTKETQNTLPIKTIQEATKLNSPSSLAMPLKPIEKLMTLNAIYGPSNALTADMIYQGQNISVHKGQLVDGKWRVEGIYIDRVILRPLTTGKNARSITLFLPNES